MCPMYQQGFKLTNMSCIVSVYLNHVIFCRSLFLFSIKTVVWYQTLADLDPLIFWPPKTFKLFGYPNVRFLVHHVCTKLVILV